FWFAFNTNKRGITLDIETADGQEILKTLVKRADFLIESFPPGYLDDLGLGYASLSQINLRLVMTSITPFGQAGPRSHYKAPDIVGMAMGGSMFITGERGKPPLRIGFPQAYLHAGAEAAVGSLVAHYHRGLTGEGQHVDVSMQACVIWTLMNETPFPILHGESQTRGGMAVTGIIRRLIFPCKDGHISLTLAGGAGASSTRALVEWMDSEGMAPSFMKEKDWEGWDAAAIAAMGPENAQKEIDAIEKAVIDFFMTHTKAEIYEEAIKGRILLAPVSTVKDSSENPQLAARRYFTPLEHSELHTTITYPGPFARLSETPITIRRRAPLIGEHNEEIYMGELGFTRAKLISLKECGVI
ncbi:MAG: CoA transferase, partial [Candidatus Tectomicrobia bacterium]|nr:CoA transferase [Candidatus Tectomicrobia bacterium]